LGTEKHENPQKKGRWGGKRRRVKGEIPALVGPDWAETKSQVEARKKEERKSG